MSASKRFGAAVPAPLIEKGCLARETRPREQSEMRTVYKLHETLPGSAEQWNLSLGLVASSHILPQTTAMGFYDSICG